MQLQYIKTLVPDLKHSQDFILNRWMQQFAVVQFLQKYKIDSSYFIDNYAVEMIANGIILLESSLQEGEFTGTKRLLHDYKEYEITAYDIFEIFKAMKNVILTIIEEGDILSTNCLFNKDKIIIDLNNYFEEVTESLLHYYAHDYYHHDKSQLNQKLVPKNIYQIA